MEFLGGLVAVIVIIAPIVLIVALFINSHKGTWDWDWVDIPCDGHCGNMCEVRKSEYKKKEHKAGLVKYYCRSCRAAGLH